MPEYDGPVYPMEAGAARAPASRFFEPDEIHNRWKWAEGGKARQLNQQVGNTSAVLNRGLVGMTLGAPVDLMNIGVNTVRALYGVLGFESGLLKADQLPKLDHEPVGGSEWIGNRIQGAGLINAHRSPLLEMGASFATPAGVTAMARAAPAVASYASNVARRVSSPMQGGPRGTVGMFHSPVTEAEKALANEALGMELAGKNKTEISLKTGTARFPDQDGYLIEMDDSKVFGAALDAVGRRRPAAQKNRAEVESALMMRSALNDGKTPAVVERIMRQNNMPVNERVKSMSQSSMADLQDFRHQIMDQMAQPISDIPIAEVLPHKRLFERFPELEQIKVHYVLTSELPKDTPAIADLVNGIIKLDAKFIRNADGGKKNLLHELQHFVDKREGRSAGTSTEELMKADPTLTERRATNRYFNQAGEARARVTANSANLDETQRREQAGSEFNMDGGRLDRRPEKLWFDNEVVNNPSAKTLKESLEGETHTLKTLERLPMNRDEISIQTIREQMARPDVTKSEKDVLEKVLERAPADGHIDAEDLVQRVTLETANFQLAGKDSSQWADYGLQRIQRASDGELPLGEGGVKNVYASNARTTQWELPQGVVSDTGNHFGNPNYFAHTRAFEEDGIPHVIELQSDLAQKAGKVLSGAERAELEKNLDNVKRQQAVIHSFATRSEAQSLNEFRKSLPEFLEKMMAENPDFDMKIGKEALILDYTLSSPRGDPEEAFAALIQRMRSQRGEADSAKRIFRRSVEMYDNHIDLLLDEHLAKLNASNNTDPIRPMLKNWDRRLVNEELARAARERADLPARIKEVRDFMTKFAEEKEKLDNMIPGVYDGNRTALDRRSDRLAQLLDENGKNLKALEAQLAAPPVVRFASADTVAKVEGWHDRLPQVQGEYDNLVKALKNSEDKLAHWKKMTNIGEVVAAHERIPEATERVAHMKKSVEESKKKLEDMKAGRGDLHRYGSSQGIYDRYAKEITNHLKSLGGKPYVDHTGNTWIEVPVKSGRVPLFSMSGAPIGLGALSSQESDD